MGKQTVGKNIKRTLTPATIARGYRQKANKVLAGTIGKKDTVAGMKRILQNASARKATMKRLKGLVKRRPPSPLQEAVIVRRNDPLAIGIEELEQCFWPSTRSRLRLSS